jgi:penicillin amidase
MKLVRRLAILVAIAFAPILLIAAGVLGYIWNGVVAGGRDATGVLQAPGLLAAVRIDRDARGIPHVRARNERDAFFAQGYLEGSDRLFQMDIYRRLVAGRLAEVFGDSALENDMNARVYDPIGLVTAEAKTMSAQLRTDAEAYSEGVNFAMRTRPLPPEFRILGYQPEPWTPQDSLLAGTATVLDLADRWYDVQTRVDVGTAFGVRVQSAFYPITDPTYDSPIEGKPAPVPPLPSLAGTPLQPVSDNVPNVDRSGLGSNDFAAGAALSATHRALLANDPHLELVMPGIWYLIDLEAPGFHVAGASLAGTPGVILGHNEHVAWGATNGTITSTLLYRERFQSPNSERYLAGKRWVAATKGHENFKVRFGNSRTRDYLMTRHGFVIGEGAGRYAVAWTGERDKRASFNAFSGLWRAANAAGAFRALADYPGPTQNFVVADDRGNTGYVMAGDVWLDPHWSFDAIDGPTSPDSRPVIPFAQMPQVKPSRDALVFSANNRTYGAGYPYRLTTTFEAPYRAARIAQLIRGRYDLDVAAFSRVQADVLSLAERDIARATLAALKKKNELDDPVLKPLVDGLRDFDGHYVGASRGAVYASALRIVGGARLVHLHLGQSLGDRYLNGAAGDPLMVLMRALRERPRGWVPNDDYDSFLVQAAREAVERVKKLHRDGLPWSDVGARIAMHPLASLGINSWNGTRFPGYGDGFSPHVQGNSNTQSFRAVWEVGNWQAGGIVLPQGESGEPGSPHYRDSAQIWLQGTLVPLPFGDAAVAKASVETLELKP